MKSEDGLKILAPQLGFCSDTQLSNYCRRYFKKTSSEIRKANSWSVHELKMSYFLYFLSVISFRMMGYHFKFAAVAKIN